MIDNPSHAELWRRAAMAICFIDEDEDGTLTKWEPPYKWVRMDDDEPEPERKDDDG